MKFDYGLPAALIGVSIALIQPHVAVALSPTEVSKIAKDITVMIERTDSKSQGSGAIVKRDGNTYTVLTAAHVVETAAKYTIVAPDGERYQMDYSTLKKRPGVDLAIVQFSSSKTYKVAKIGNSDAATEGAEAYVCGFPVPSSARPHSEFNFIQGSIIANGSQIQPDGYALVYSNNTRLGMSGGPVLNQNGELIGIHGRSETAVNSNVSDENFQVIATGNNLGIPINTFLKLSLIDVGIQPPSQTTAAAPTAADFYLQGWDKYQKGDRQGAIAAYDQAIQLNPKYAYAYKDRGIVRYYQGDYQGAIEDFNAAIRLDPKFAFAYAGRGMARYAVLKDNRGVMEDFNAAINLNPKLAPIYAARGYVRYSQGDNRGAMEDFNTAINLDSKSASAYASRGYLRFDQGDHRGAIEDYNQALSLDPKLARTYGNRGVARFKLGDNRGAMEDLNAAINLDPKDAITYKDRGLIRLTLGDVQGAMEDFNTAINLDPQSAGAYAGRGVVRFALGDKQEGLAELQRAANLAQQQKNQKLYQNIQNMLRAVQQQ